MTDRPILFSAPMVQALLAGRKTQTRRVIKPRGRCSLFEPGQWSDSYVLDAGNAEWRARDVRFAVGDRLWVKETWHAEAVYDDTKPSEIPFDACCVLYAAGQKWSYRDQMNRAGKTRVSIFMPRWASRLTLLVTDVRVERLQDCSEVDAIAEGVECHKGSDGALAEYEMLWDSINGPGAWDANPWIVAISFEVQHRNIDHVSVAA